MFFLELTTGLRKGELVALLWSNLDEKTMVLNVCKQVVGIKGGGVKVTRSKTETSEIYELNDHLYEGRYSPTNAQGKREVYTVYARTREEVEPLLEKMIGEVAD